MIWCAGCGRKYPLWRRLLRLSWRCPCGVGAYVRGGASRRLLIGDFAAGAVHFRQLEDR